jgi:pimeloyl-ACP methyl ester carboxylesterase
MTAPPRVLILRGGEPILHHGASDGPQLLLLQPLFEEMNRCRALVATLCRTLAERGFGCWLPDLPGCGESIRELETVGWDDWTGAIEETSALIRGETGNAAIGTVAIRGGALLDAPAPHRWRLSPVAGASLLTDLRRAGLLASGGYSVSDALAGSLSRAEPHEVARVVRLDGDERSCDLRLEGPAIWRRSEPFAAPELAALIAEDVHDWADAIVASE